MMKNSSKEINVMDGMKRLLKCWKQPSVLCTPSLELDRIFGTRRNAIWNIKAAEVFVCAEIKPAEICA